MSNSRTTCQGAVSCEPNGTANELKDLDKAKTCITSGVTGITTNAIETDDVPGSTKGRSAPQTGPDDDQHAGPSASLDPPVSSNGLHSGTIRRSVDKGTSTGGQDSDETLAGPSCLDNAKESSVGDPRRLSSAGGPASSKPSVNDAEHSGSEEQNAVHSTRASSDSAVALGARMPPTHGLLSPRPSQDGREAQGDNSQPAAPATASTDNAPPSILAHVPTGNGQPTSTPGKWQKICDHSRRLIRKVSRHGPPQWIVYFGCLCLVPASATMYGVRYNETDPRIIENLDLAINLVASMLAVTLMSLDMLGSNEDPTNSTIAWFWAAAILTVLFWIASIIAYSLKPELTAMMLAYGAFVALALPCGRGIERAILRGQEAAVAAAAADRERDDLERGGA